MGLRCYFRNRLKTGLSERNCLEKESQKGPEMKTISAMCTALENKREAALGYADALEEKITVIGKLFSVSSQSVWAICVLQRCAAIEHQCTRRSEMLEK
jgi:hypothetical protein